MYVSTIVDLREDHDLTQTQVAKLLSMSQTGYSNMRQGENDIPTQVLLNWRTLRHQRGLPFGPHR